MINCPTCGKLIDDKMFKYCPFCGSAIPTAFTSDNEQNGNIPENNHTTPQTDNDTAFDDNPSFDYDLFDDGGVPQPMMGSSSNNQEDNEGCFDIDMKYIVWGVLIIFGLLSNLFEKCGCSCS